VPYSTGGYSSDYYDDYYSDNDYYSVPGVSASIQVLVQTALARRGYYAGQVDGVIGPETRNAIREFQRDNGLQVTGDINSQLVQALKLG
jgi:peptidoglycan hydrolase-like protein with peptidoglycan-binding domain